MATLRQKVADVKKKFNEIVSDLEAISTDYSSDLHSVRYRVKSKDARDLVTSYTGHNLFDGDMLIWILKDRLSPEFIKYLTRLQEGIPKGRRIKPSKEKNDSSTSNLRVRKNSTSSKRSSGSPKKPSSKARSGSNGRSGRRNSHSDSSKRG